MNTSDNMPEIPMCCCEIKLELVEIIENGSAKTFIYRDANEPEPQLKLPVILFYLSLLLLGIIFGVSVLALIIVFRWF